MRNISTLSYPFTCCVTYGNIMKGLLLSMAIVLFNFTQVHAQVNNATQAADNAIVGTSPNMGSEGNVDPSWYNLDNLSYGKGSDLFMAKEDVMPADNPDLSPTTLCEDLRVVLVLDESGSILTNNGVEQVRAGTMALATSFKNSAASLTITEFAAGGRVVNLGGMHVDDAYLANLHDYLYNDYNGQSYDPTLVGLGNPCPIVNTNWQDGFIVTKSSFPNLILFLTDGEPNTYNVDTDCGYVLASTPEEHSIALGNAIIEANELKLDYGTHIFAIGVTDNVNLTNLKLISGEENFAIEPDIYTADYSIGNFAALEENLTAGINSICGTTLAVTKSSDINQVCSDDQVITFTLSVENTGGLYDYTAINLVLRDTFPSDYSNLTIVGGPISGASIDGQILVYNAGDLAANESISIQVSATLSGGLGNYPNNAYAKADNATVVSGGTSIEIVAETYSTTYVSNCGDYLWPVNGETYSTGGEYIFNGTNSAGCPSADTLNLTINEPRSGEESKVACESYEWNGQLYEASGDYDHVFEGENGLCDSTATLHLTINEPAFGDQYETACGSFTWYGQTYYSTPATNPTRVFYGGNGLCDSTATLHLTVGQLGGSCDDGDPMTIDDTINANCECVGTPTDVDCLGVVGGTATTDECGVCDSDPTNDCTQDCLGVWGGTASMDECGVCDADPSNDCTQDCLGVWGGTASMDECGVCDADPSNDCTQDCLGEWGGTATMDECGVCDDNTSNDCIKDCADVWGGTAFMDECGVCDSDPSNDCVADCNGDFGGTAYLDNCGTCVGGNTGETACNNPAPTCNNYVYYLSNHPVGEATTDIYKVTLNGGDADLEYIITSNEEVHIAYNSIDNLIYAVARNSHSYRTLDPNAAVPEFGPDVNLGDSLSLITTAVFSPDGKLLFSSNATQRIYSVNVDTEVVSVYDNFAPVEGGDLAYTTNGMLYLASNIGAGLYEVWPQGIMPDQLLPATIPSNVMGMATTDMGQLLISCRGKSNFVLRNTDGSDAGSYAVKLDGNTFTLGSGDMASGCDTHTNIVDGCDYKLYYIHTPAGGGNNPLLEVTLNNDGTASYNAIIANMPGHLGLSPDGATIYVANGSNLKVIDVETASVISSKTVKNAAGKTISGIPAVVVGADGTLYVGSSSKNQVYTVDPITGTAIPYGPSRTVQGGDLIEADGEIWLITRNNNKFTNVMTGANFTVPVNEINGAAVLDNGNVLLVDGNGGSLMKEVDLSTQMVVGTYDIGLPLHNGDLAGNCTMSNPVEEGCYGAEIIDFSQGPQTNGGAIPADRSDATKALGEPDKSNAAGGFVSLGVGGSITIGFGGVVIDETGADIKIWETSFSGDVCSGGSDEKADIELSADGVNFVSVGTICRDGEVDMADVGLTHVSAIRITNAASTGSLDGYDVDGVEAINGCSNEPEVIPGECYAAEVVEYVQGVKSNGGAIDINRTDANEALGMPERTDNYVFVTLGYGGSITLAFNGAVPNGEGHDIEVVETTWGHVTCNTEPEFANVSVSVDGENWAFAKTICRADGFVDISDAGDFEYINFVKIENNDAMTSTHDGFDVDGVLALHNCEEVITAPQAIEPQSQLSSSPNPTSGTSQVIFSTAKTGETFVDVYDMNGRKIATIFDQVAQEGQEYTIDFNALSLPNGFYVYVLTNNGETSIERFLIAK